MDLSKATTLEVGQLNRPIITAYQLSLIIFNLYKNKKYKGENLTALKKKFPTSADYQRILQRLQKSGVLQNAKDIPSDNVYSVIGQKVSSAEEAICLVDPFCYISHFNAMVYHGLTDRFPKILFITSPPPKSWSMLAKDRMEKDLGEDYLNYKSQSLPSLRHNKLQKILKKTISSLTSNRFDAGAYVTEQGKFIRVSTIGRTFLDMVQEPNLCGGIYHVLDIYKKHAERYLKLIIDEVEQRGDKIDKVRMGYILDERLGYKDRRIEGWRKFVQRGGSRKLVAQNPYVPRFSEKWEISINIEESES